MTGDPQTGVGLHIGEKHVCVARILDSGQTATAVQPAVMALVPFESLGETKWESESFPYNGQALLVGEAALETAAVLPVVKANLTGCGRLEVHQPMAEFALTRILDRLLGAADSPAQLCVYATPAPWMDPSNRLQYHATILRDIIRKLGYLPFPLEEAKAVVLTELGSFDRHLFALACDFYQVHGCLSSRGIVGVDFTREPGGDWIEHQVGETLGVDSEDVRRIVDNCQNICLPRNREEEALLVFTRQFIDKLLADVTAYFEQRGVPLIVDPIRAIWTGDWPAPGGTAALLLRQAKQQSFPIPLAEVRSLTAPQLAVALGCLHVALVVEKNPDQSFEVEIR